MQRDGEIWCEIVLHKLLQHQWWQHQQLLQSYQQHQQRGAQVAVPVSNWHLVTWGLSGNPLVWCYSL